MTCVGVRELMSCSIWVQQKVKSRKRWTYSSKINQAAWQASNYNTGINITYTWTFCIQVHYTYTWHYYCTCTEGRMHSSVKEYLVSSTFFYNMLQYENTNSISKLIQHLISPLKQLASRCRRRWWIVAPLSSTLDFIHVLKPNTHLSILLRHHRNRPL